MFSGESVVYPLLSVLFVIGGAVLIKVMFHRNKHLPNHRIKPIGHDEMLRARYAGSRVVFFMIAIAAITGWACWQLWSVQSGHYAEFRPFYLLFGSLFIFQLITASTIKVIELRHEHDYVDKFHTAVIIAAYNESENSLRECLQSIFYQTVLPNEIHVVDDGSKHHYTKTKSWFLKTAKLAGIKASWQKQENAGKRMAHDTAIKAITNKKETIIVTIDSDGILDPHAIEEGLKPFNDIRVQSVAGLVIAKNAQKNLLARITDLIFVSAQQLIDRSAMSQFGSVLVNSGGLAFYRSSAVHSAIEHGYTSEQFFGRHIHFSDDSFLTLFALLKGRTVQQPSSIVFADMPVTLSHHIRQQLRWNRGSFIRSWWRLRHLSMNSYGWLRQVVGFVVFFSLNVIMIQILVIIPVTHHEFPPVQLFVVPLLFGLLQYSRYFSVMRSDMTLKSQMLTYLLTPLAVMWSAIVLRLLRLYSFATCLNTGWGTRKRVEILHFSDEHGI